MKKVIYQAEYKTTSSKDFENNPCCLQVINVINNIIIIFIIRQDKPS